MTANAEHPEFERFISVDIETAGPHPGRYAMLSIGACQVANPNNGFYVELKPDRPEMETEAAASHGLTLPELSQRGLEPALALERFATWLATAVPGQNPIFVALNAPFDWMFINDYFHRYLGENPFGHTALDIKAYYMGHQGALWSESNMAVMSRQFLDDRALTHNALQDARDQAEVFTNLLAAFPGEAR